MMKEKSKTIKQRLMQLDKEVLVNALLGFPNAIEFYEVQNENGYWY